jgi:hypothetical protein
MIGIVIAMATLTVFVVGVVVTLSFKLSTSRGETGDARVHEEALSGQLAIANAAIETERSRGDSEKRRADALDDLIARHAAEAAGPVDGAFKRLLADWAKPSDPASGSSADAVSKGTAAATPGPDDLLKPGG